MNTTVFYHRVLLALALAIVHVRVTAAPPEQPSVLGTVVPQQFGAKADGRANDTSAVQAAIDAAIARHSHVMLSGNYRVDTIKIRKANGLHVLAHGALLIGSRDGVFPAVLEVENSSDVSITGKLEVSAQNNPHYEAGIWVHSDRKGANGASKLQFFDVSVASAKLAWRFGSASVPNALISEIAVHGGHTYSCSGVIEVIGYESVVNFIGYNIISDDGDKHQWKSQPETSVRIIGGSLIIIGGEVQHNADTKDALISVEPDIAEHGLMSYGNIYVANAAVETAAPLAITSNPLGRQAPDTGVINIHNCFGYHANDLGPFVRTDPTYSGWLVMKDNNFYAGAKRSQPNIVASHTTKLDVDVKSFGRNFKQGLDGIVGGCFPESERSPLRPSANLGR